MKENNFWLNKKGMGAIVFLLFCIVYSLYLGFVVNSAVSAYIPVLKDNVSDFLPITFENGMIVKPANTIIERQYGENDNKFNVVLNTQTEEFAPALLKDNGIYISRTAIYTVSSTKNEVRINSLREMPNMVIDEEIVNTVLVSAERYVIPVVFMCTFLWFLLGGLIVMGIYSLVLHWIMSALYKAPYRQTLRLTVYGYVLFNVAGIFINIPHFFWSGFILIAILNIVVNQYFKNTAETKEK